MQAERPRRSAPRYLTSETTPMTRASPTRRATRNTPVPAPPRARRFPLPLSIAFLALTAAAPGTVAPDTVPGIAELYERALENDARFAAAEARREAEALAPGIARARLLPRVELRARHARVAEDKVQGQTFGGAGSFSYDTDQLVLSLRQTLFNRGDYIALKQSKSESEKADLELAAARQALILNLAEAYFGVLLAEESLKFARSEKEAVSRQLEQARERFDVGVVPITDVKEAEAAFDLAEAEEILADNQSQNALYALSVITGNDFSVLRPLAESVPTPTPDPEDVQAWVDRALAQNLGLLARQIATNVAAREIDLQRAGHYPSVDLFANRAEDDIRGGRRKSESKNLTIGVEVNVPVFSGLGTHYRTRRAAQLHRESLEQLEGARRETRRVARENYLNVIASVSRVAALKRAEESALAALESNEAGFQVGTRTSVDVLLALKDLFRARRDYASVRYEYLLSTLRLKNVAGTLSEEDVARLDSYLADRP